ncbi:hypothetical protein VB005_02188 [Metarhizium brunneum]
MKSPIALIAIMAGLAIAHPLAGSTDIRGYSDTANTIQEVRNKLMRCLERRKPVGTKPNWSIVIASQYTSRDEILRALAECEGREQS